MESKVCEVQYIIVQEAWLQWKAEVQTEHSAAVWRPAVLHRAEDGDCLEAAESPPELIPGGSSQGPQGNSIGALGDNIKTTVLADTVRLFS